MDNCLSYCGLVDPRRSASDKDLTVQFLFDRGTGIFLNKEAKQDNFSAFSQNVYPPN